MYLPGRALEKNLASILVPEITVRQFNDYSGDQWFVLDSVADLAQLSQLGILITGEQVTCALRKVDRRLGQVKIHAAKRGTVIIFDNADWAGALSAGCRLQGADCVVLFNLGGFGSVQLGNLYLRSDDQLLFWGLGATSVNCRAIEIEGSGHFIAVGDDAMFAAGVSIRNHDMHSIVDTMSMTVLNGPRNTVVEQHVWLGQDSLIMCERIGLGSVVGARSLVKASLPRMVLAAGTPARILQEQRTWGRDVTGLSAREEELIRSFQSLSSH